MTRKGYSCGRSDERCPARFCEIKVYCALSEFLTSPHLVKITDRMREKYAGGGGSIYELRSSPSSDFDVESTLYSGKGVQGLVSASPA
jgi:hypothetical protein